VPFFLPQDGEKINKILSEPKTCFEILSGAERQPGLQKHFFSSYPTVNFIQSPFLNSGWFKNQPTIFLEPLGYREAKICLKVLMGAKKVPGGPKIPHLKLSLLYALFLSSGH
jgi:hypothetical protein